jgi:hypothetical protein
MMNFAFMTASIGVCCPSPLILASHSPSSPVGPPCARPNGRAACPSVRAANPRPNEGGCAAGVAHAERGNEREAARRKATSRNNDDDMTKPMLTTTGRSNRAAASDERHCHGQG